MAVDIDQTLAACEAALSRPGKVNLRPLGFWKAVSAVKRDPALVERYADRIARIDREAFVRSAPIVMLAGVGLVVEAVGTAVGVALVAAAPSLPSPWGGVAYVVGGGTLIGMTHSLAHWVVGSLRGIRFTHFYSLPPFMPQPGFKIDYASYLRVPARSRAWMHASGAIVSKIVPFVVAANAVLNGAEVWAVAVLLAIGVGQLITDVTLSTRASDWKKFRREMRFAS